MAYETQTQTQPRGVYAPQTGGTVEGGSRAGLFAGLVMAVFWILAWGATGLGPMTPFKTIAAMFGVNALVGGWGTVIVGAVIHFLVSAAFGVIFASMIRANASKSQAFWGGLVYGVGVWAVMTYIGLPIFDSVMRERVALMPGTWFLSHLIFGACLYGAPQMKRDAARRAVTRTERERIEVAVHR